eukprot:jgi/Botrbrau1/179/Bobra.0022s0159.2
MAWLRSHEARLGLLSMALLVFQGTALSLTLRYSRTRAGRPYLASVAVIYTELIKLLICIGAQMRESVRTAGERDHSVADEVRHQFGEILGKSFPMFVPAALFVMQQVLVIVAASHLDAVTFQICSQSFKILPTAFFAVWLLGQFLNPMQWASLPVLVIGVVFVTLNGSTAKQGTPLQPAASSDHLLLGLGASALSGLSSAYAGVYFEKYVKGKMGQTLWIRNLQLSIYGLPLAVMYSILKDGREIKEAGFLQGFDILAWSVVALQVFGGLIVGMVVKYADNILKNFANALSVIFTVLGAIPLFGQWPSFWFIIGIAAVMCSVFMYSGTIPDPGLASCAKHASWANMYGILSCDDCAAGGRRRSSDGGGGLSPAIRWCLRAMLLCTAAIGLIVFTLSAPAVTHEGLGDDGRVLGRRGGMTAGVVHLHDPRIVAGFEAHRPRMLQAVSHLQWLVSRQTAQPYVSLPYKRRRRHS